MKIRPAEQTDCPELARLRWQVRIEEDGESAAFEEQEFLTECARFFSQGIKDGSHICWLAVEDELIVSHICVQIVPMIPRPLRIEDRYGYLTNSYTLPAYRNKGIGSQLLEHVIEWALEQDLELLIVWPSERAVSFYERLGFDPKHDILQLTLRAYDEPSL